MATIKSRRATWRKHVKNTEKLRDAYLAARPTDWDERDRRWNAFMAARAKTQAAFDRLMKSYED